MKNGRYYFVFIFRLIIGVVGIYSIISVGIVWCDRPEKITEVSTERKTLQAHNLASSKHQWQTSPNILLLWQLFEQPFCKIWESFSFYTDNPQHPSLNVQSFSNFHPLFSRGSSSSDVIPKIPSSNFQSPSSYLQKDFSRPEIVGRISKGNFGTGKGFSFKANPAINIEKKNLNSWDWEPARCDVRIRKLAEETGEICEKSGELSKPSPDLAGVSAGIEALAKYQIDPERKHKRLIGYRREPLIPKESKPKVVLAEPKSGKMTLESGESPYRVSIKADEIRHSGGLTTASGNVNVEYRGITVNADKIEYNQFSRDITAEGKVSISRGEDKITGSSLRYNLLTQSADIEDAYGYAKDVNMGEVPLQKTIFFWGKQVRWDKGIIYIKQGKATACDIPPPDYHYHITGDEIIIYPRDKMIVRKARFIMGKSQWLGLRNAVFSLRQRDPRSSQSYIPQVGKNEQEGEYIKESIGYMLGQKDYGTVHVDWYRKVGIGAGLEHYYHIGDGGAGKIYNYRMGSSNNPTNRYNFSNRTYYRFPGNFFGSFSYSTERYEFPEYCSPNIKNADFYLSRFTEKAKMALYLQDYIEGNNRNYGVNFIHRYDFSDRWQSQALLDFLSSETSIKRLYRFNVQGRLLYRGDIFDSSLVYDRTWGDRKFYVNREPELAFQSHDLETGPLDWRASLAVGSFHEMPSNVSTFRSDLRLSLLNKIYHLTDSTNFSVAGGFRQLLYGTGERKYVIRGCAGLEQKFGSDFSIIATYFVQDRNGFSPLALDYFDKYQVLGATLEYFNRKNLRMQVNGGYDFDHKQFQSLIPRVEYCPSKDWIFLLSSNYDIKNKLWMNIDGEVGMKLAKQISLKYWGLYDFTNKKMTYQDYVVEFDSHDFATRFIYKGNQGELWLSIALKLFPYEKIEVGPNENRNVVDKRLLQRAPDEEGL